MLKDIFEKSMGGDLAATAVSFIPGLGQILPSVISMIDNRDRSSQPTILPQLQTNLNPFGKFKNGGFLNDGFKQYNTGSHDSGNDLLVDENGNPNPNATNSVQNNENSFRLKNGKQYVMSDTLRNPKTGMKFSEEASQINKKYDGRRDMDQRSALDFEMGNLAKINDSLKLISESFQKSAGGALGDPVRTRSWVDPSGKVHPGEDQLEIETLPNNDENVPKSDLFNFSPEYKVEVPKVESSQERSSQITESDAGFGANALGVAAKGFGLLSSINDALSSPEQEKLILPDYTKSDAYIKAANIDYSQAKQDAIGVSNISGNVNRSLSSGASVYQARESSRLAQLQDAMSRISESQNNAQSQLNLTKGQYEQNKALDTANRRYQNQQNQQMNDANARFFDRQLASDLTQIGTSLNKYGETQKLIQNEKDLNRFNTTQALTILQSKYPGWSIDPAIIEQFKSGKIGMDEFLKYTPTGFNQELKR